MDIYGFLAILASAVAIWAMVMVSQSDMPGNKKVLWFIIVVLIPILGPLVYYFMKLR
ncbi:MAG: PLDc_N domain-containing protein [Reichenbachiella sp.]